MVFSESTIRIRTRVRSAFGRLRPSKSSLELTPHVDSTHGQILGSKLPSFVTPPVLILPESHSKNFELGDILKITPAQASINPEDQVPRTLVKPVYGSSESAKIPALTQMLEQQGLTNSPISIHLASLVLLGDASHSRVSISTDPRIRSSTDSALPSTLLCSPSAGPFTPELVSNPVGSSTPEFSASYSSTPVLGSSFLDSPPKACLPDSFESSTLGMAILNSQKDPQGGETFWISPSNAPTFTRKLSASPARPCLRRSGPIPCTHPISPQLLCSLISPHEPPHIQNHCDDFMNEHDERYAKRSSIAAQSIELECYSPGGNPMDKITLDDEDCGQQELMARHMKAFFLAHPPNLKNSRSAPSLSQSKRSSASSFMTDVTGYETLESEH